MTTEAENFENTEEVSLSDDSDIEIVADEKGREIRKSAEHPDKTRDIICLENSEEDEEDEETQNLNNNSVVLDRVTKKTEVHETISVSPTINAGTIKEYLTELGLGILRCRENGIVLFHCDNLWLNGKNASQADASPSDIRRKFLPGTRINYMELVAKSPEYGTISPSYNLPQAFAVWPVEEQKPRGIPHQVQEELDYDLLKVWRMDFVQDFKEDKFLRLDCVKVLAQVKAYFDDENGVMEIMERKDGGFYVGKKVFFNRQSVRLFKKPLNARDRLREVIPIGLRVSFDGIRVENKPSLTGKFFIEFQACYLFAGTWPQNPDPTCFPATDGFRSYAPDYCPGTWCYLNCDLKSQLDAQLNRMADKLDNDRRMHLQFFDRDGYEIRNAIDHGNWKRRYAPSYYNHDRPRVPNGVGNLCGGIKRKQQQANTFGGFREQIMVKVEPKSEKFKKHANETYHDASLQPPSKRPRTSFMKTERR